MLGWASRRSALANSGSQGVNDMSKILLSIAAVAAATIAVPASAATIVDCATTTGKCSDASEGVNIANGTNLVSVLGTTHGGIQVEFTAPELLNAANGLATVSASDGVLGTFKFELLNGATFTSASFNLDAPTGTNNDAFTSAITFGFSDGSASQTLNLGSGGAYQFGVLDGEGITSITFVSAGAPDLGIGAFKQLKFGGLMASAVPEPGTWAMMLIGFGAIGASMRRRRSNVAGTLAQMA